MSKLHHVLPARLGLAVLLLLAAPLVWGHASVIDTQPEDGGSLPGSPDTVAIEFDGEMQLTAFEVSGPDGRVSLENGLEGESGKQFEASFAESLPAGEYTVSWRGLAADGHAMSDSFSFTVED